MCDLPSMMTFLRWCVCVCVGEIFFPLNITVSGTILTQPWVYRSTWVVSFQFTDNYLSRPSTPPSFADKIQNLHQILNFLNNKIKLHKSSKIIIAAQSDKSISAPISFCERASQEGAHSVQERQKPDDREVTVRVQSHAVCPQGRPRGCATTDSVYPTKKNNSLHGKTNHQENR